MPKMIHFRPKMRLLLHLCLPGSPLHYQHHHHPASLLPHHQHYHLPFMGHTHFPFPYPGSAGSPKPAGIRSPLTRVASNPTFPSVSSPAPGSPGPQSESPGGNEGIAMSPPAPQHPNMWPPHTQPLFSLANVISMAMSMAQSFIPPAQGMPSYPGFHPQLPTHMAPQSGYPSVYPQQYQTPPLEAPYPTVGVQAHNSLYHSPESMPQADGAAFSQGSPPSWQHPVTPPSMPPSPPLQQAGFSGPPGLNQENGLNGYVAPYSAQVPAHAKPKPQVSSSNSSSDLSPSPPESPESTVSHPRSYLRVYICQDFQSRLVCMQIIAKMIRKLISWSITEKLIEQL